MLQEDFSPFGQVPESSLGRGGNAGGAVREGTEPDELDNTPSARVTLEVRILDSDVTSRHHTPEHTPVQVPPGAGPLVVVVATDPDLSRYLHAHLADVKSWRVVAAENEAQALTLLQRPFGSPEVPVLVLDAPDMALLTRLPHLVRTTLRVVLLADAYPTGFDRRPLRHALLPWPLDVPTLVSRVAELVRRA